ncbi:MAG: hypothetical protein ACRER0_02170 [Gammaproteobacteria bacterium]
MNLADARNKTECWQQDCNTHCPHSSLDGMIPAKFDHQHTVMQNSAGTNSQLVYELG